MSEEVTVQIPTRILGLVITELGHALDPMVPYKRDPLALAEAAHEVKNAHIIQAIKMLQLPFDPAYDNPATCPHCNGDNWHHTIECYLGREPSGAEAATK